jgi:hypothetical protein
VGPVRLGVLLERGTSAVTVEVDGRTIATWGGGVEKWADVAEHAEPMSIRAVTPDGGVRGVWLVARTGLFD